MKNGVIWLGISFFGFIAGVAVVYTAAIAESVMLFVISLAATAAFFLWTIGAVQRDLPANRFVALLLAVGLGLRIAWVVGIDSPIVSDFEVMYRSALQGASGDYSFANREYYVRWGYQLGFTLYQSWALSLFGNHALVLECLNCVYQTVTVYLVYRMAALLFGEFGGRAAGVLYALYLPNVLLCSILTNQHLSVLLFALGCYWGLKYRASRRVYPVMAVALCFALAHLIRPLGSVFLLCFVVCLALSEWRASGSAGDRARMLIRKSICLAAVYFLVLQAANLALIGSGIANRPMENREPYWKFVVGLNSESYGLWNEADARYVMQYPLGEERDRAELALIKERIRDPVKLAGLFVRKYTMMWGGEDSAVEWSLAGLNLPLRERALTVIERCQYILIAFFGMLTGLQSLRIRRRQSAVEEAKDQAVAPILPLLILWGYASLHLLIEIQIRYRFDILPYFIVLSGAGARYFMEARLRKNRQ